MLTLLYLIQPMRKIPNDKRGNLLYTADFGIAVSPLSGSRSKLYFPKLYLIQLIKDKNTKWQILYAADFGVAVSPLSSGSGSKGWGGPLSAKLLNLNISYIKTFWICQLCMFFRHLPGVGTAEGTVAMVPLADGLSSNFFIICIIFHE